jgi:hypothetical protein
MLHLIRARHGAALARQVAASFLATVRHGHEPQVATQDPALDPRVALALARMEARIDAPEPAAPPQLPLAFRPAAWNPSSSRPWGPPPPPTRLTCACRLRGGC